MHNMLITFPQAFLSKANNFSSLLSFFMLSKAPPGSVSQMNFLMQRQPSDNFF